MDILSFLPVRPAWRQARLPAWMPAHSMPEYSLRAYYALREKELARLMQEARETQYAHPFRAVVSLLERRLENAVCRMGFAESIPQARALVRRGHILLNRYLPKSAGTVLRPGDVVHYTLRPYDASSTTRLPERPLPSYLQYLNPHTTDRGMMISLPSLDDLPLRLLQSHTDGCCPYATSYWSTF